MHKRIYRSAPFTPEDHDVVAQIVLRRGISWLAIALTSAHEGDAADAFVMYHREKYRRQCSDVGARTMRPELYWSLYPWRI